MPFHNNVAFALGHASSSRVGGSHQDIHVGGDSSAWYRKWKVEVTFPVGEDFKLRAKTVPGLHLNQDGCTGDCLARNVKISRHFHAISHI